MGWFKKEKRLEVPCLCGHLRCYHTHGEQGCHWGILAKTFDGRDCWGECPCAYYIATDRPNAVQEIKALEEMMRK